MSKNPPYSRRLIRWFCDCGKEHASEALAWACECYQTKVVCDHAGVCGASWCKSRTPHIRCYNKCKDGGPCWEHDVLFTRCVPVEAKEA